MNYLRKIIEEIREVNSNLMDVSLEFNARNRAIIDRLCDWETRLTAIAVDAEANTLCPHCGRDDMAGGCTSDDCPGYDDNGWADLMNMKGRLAELERGWFGGWRPIASAPMDGTLIFVSYGAGAVPCIAAWVEGEERGTESYWRRHGWAADSEHVESFDSYVGVVSDLASDKVTRWMPIPK